MMDIKTFATPHITGAIRRVSLIVGNQEVFGQSGNRWGFIFPQESTAAFTQWFPRQGQISGQYSLFGQMLGQSIPNVVTYLHVGQLIEDAWFARSTVISTTEVIELEVPAWVKARIFEMAKP